MSSTVARVPHHLVGATEIAVLLGLTRQRVDQLARTDPTFPEPEVALSAGRVWSSHDIEVWAEANGRALEHVHQQDEKLSKEILDYIDDPRRYRSALRSAVSHLQGTGLLFEEVADLLVLSPDELERMMGRRR